MLEEFKAKLSERIRVNVHPDPRYGTPCHVWTGRTRAGRGYFKWKGFRVAVHRAAWETHNKVAVPKGKIIVPGCAEGLCSRGDHMECTTHHANNQRLSSMPDRTSGMNVKTKLSLPQAKAILALKEERQPTAVARKYKVSKGLVQAIWRGDAWKHARSVEDRKAEARQVEGQRRLKNWQEDTQV